MRFMQQYHAKTALTYTASYAERQLIVEQTLMEIKVLAVFLTLDSKLTEKAFLIYAYSHA